MSGDKETKSENRDPYAPAVPYITDIMGRAQRLHDSGAGTGQWGGSALAGLDPRMSQSMGMIQNNAMSSNTSQPFQFGNNMLASGGMTPGMQQPMGVMSGVASGRNGINTGGIYGGLIGQSGNQNSGANGILGQFAGQDPISTGGNYGSVAGRAQNNNSDVAGLLTNVAGGPGITTGGDYRSVGQGAGGPTAADTYLTGMAQGGEQSPYLKAMMDANAERVSNRVNSSMSGAGRFGSFGHGDALVRSIAEANNPLMAAAYEGDQSRRLQATGMIDSSRQGANAQRLQAISGETGVQGQNIGNTMSAGGLLGNLRNQNFATELSALGGQTGAEGANASTRIGAASGLSDSNRADTGMALNATQGLTGVQGANISNRMGASQGLLGAYGQGADRAAQWSAMAPSNYAFQNAPAQDIGRIGEYMQGRSQTEQDFQRQQFEQQNQMPWQQLARYSGGVTGMAPLIGNAGSTTSTTTKETDPLKTAIGLGIAGGSMMMGNPGPMMGMGMSTMASGFGGGGFNPNVAGGWDQTMGNPYAMMGNPYAMMRR